ncbi:MAG: hypothetical protein KAW41_03810 [Candidatus Diapherotrites archaeon]|nr:hypothetical protein [Candidatus Diapherotrites archaeon]
MPLFTTSRKPCARVRSLVKEMARLIPGSVSLTRGKQPIDSVAEKARQEGYSVVAVVTGRHGNPSSIRVLEVDEAGWEWGKEFPIKGVRLGREFGRSKRPDALAVEDEIGFAEALGVEPGESDTVLSANKDAITFIQGGAEVGPRLHLRKEKA